MFSDADTVPSAIGNFKLSPFMGVNTSFALGFVAWISDVSIFFSSSMSATNMSPFQTPRTTHIQGIYLAGLLGQIDVVSIGLQQK